MSWFKDLPINRRLALVMLVTCSAGLVLAGGAIAGYELYDFRRTLARDAAVLADIVGQNTGAALAFDDENGAQQVLQALRAEVHVEGARLYGRSGERFTEYVRTGKKVEFDATVTEESVHFTTGHLIVVHSVMLDDKRVGLIELVLDLEGIGHRLRLFGLIMTGVLVGSLIGALAVAYWLQRSITGPIVALSHTARHVEEKRDYAVRAAVPGRDEVGQLAEAFNTMLAGIQERAQALRAEIADRRRAEERSAQLATIVDSSDDAIISKALNGTITSWNRGAEKVFGYTAAEAIGQSIRMLVPTEREKEVEEILERTARDETIVHHETERQRKDGRRIAIAATISPIHDAAGVVIGASEIARDITAAKAAQAALATSERHYRLIFAGSPLPKWIYDPESLRFLAVNRAAQAHYGYTEREFLALTIRDIRPHDEVTDFDTAMSSAKAGAPMKREWRHRRKDGSVIDVVVNSHDVDFGSRRARLVVVQDVTERRLAERKVQAQLARLALLNQITRATGERQDLPSIFQVVVRSLEDHLPLDFCSVCLYDSASHELVVGRVGAQSLRFATELGMLPDARVPIDENGLSRCVRGILVYEPDVTATPFPFPQRLARGGLRAFVAAPLLMESKVFGLVLAARTQAESFSSAECEFLKQVSEHVALAAHQAQLHTALQQAYDELRQTQQAILQQERLRALGQMASGIAHDINNAISPVALYTESLLETDKTLSPRARDYLGTIQHAIDDVAQTVARMREFYRQREPQMQLAPVNLNRLVQQVLDLTRARWNDMPQQRGVMIELRTKLAETLPNIAGVESEIREALTNLVFNAVDAMPVGGRLTLATRVEPPPQSDGSARVIVEVSDTGVGMDEDTRRRCLEPFFTTKGERGTGLGLAMVYGAVQRHSADIEIDSEPGRGTTMRLVFAAALESVRTAEPAAEQPLPPKLKILAVDDDPILIRALQDTLAVDGHRILAASGGQEGIDLFRRERAAGEPFDVVITDLGMPYVDGRRVASAIKETEITTPVIMLTGWGQRLVADGEVPPHVDQVLGKPPKLRELRETLVRWCGKREP